jgi:hypothetical protein
MGEIFRTRPDWPCFPTCLLYNGYRFSFPDVKFPRRGVNHPPKSSAEVKERIELYLYSPSGPSWPVLGLNAPFTFLAKNNGVTCNICLQISNYLSLIK